jgi:AcrR family transcriptional regulator
MSGQCAGGLQGIEVDVVDGDRAILAGDQQRQRRGSYAKSETTKAAILDAALEVFAQGGFRAGSLRDVAQRVGMSEAGLLHHFRNKSDLLAAVLERRDTLALQFVPAHPHDGVRAVRGLIELARYNASEPGVVELYCTLSAEATTPGHPAHEYFVRRYDEKRSSLFDAFSDVAARKLLREGVTPEYASQSTLSIMDGLQIQWLLDRSLLDMADELRRHLLTLTTIDL